MTPVRKNRIMIFGPKDDDTYVVEFRTAEVASTMRCSLSQKL